MSRRETAAYLLKTHGAWLIHWVGEEAQDRPEDENFDAASSVVVAKRLAVEGARDNGYSGAVRWSGDRWGWALEMSIEDD